jgi:hypothetical protein
MTKKPTTSTAITSKPVPTRTAVAKPVKTLAAPKSTVKPAPKPVAKALTPTVVKPAVEKVIKAKKLKQIRDSFNMPKAEYAVLDELKARAATLTQPVKKSELLRAGIKALAAMSDSGFLTALKDVPTIKTGRPKK